MSLNQERKRTHLSVAGIYGGALFIGMTLASVPANSAFLKSLHGFSDHQYGALFVGQLMFALFGALLAGPAVSRLSLKTLYAISLISLMASQICLMVSSSQESDVAFWLVRGSLAFFGFGFGFGGGPINGLVCLNFPKSMFSAVTALHMTAGIGLMSAPIYFRVIGQYVDWWIASASIIVGILVVLLVTLSFIDKDPPKIEKSRRDTRLPLDMHYFWIMVVIAFCYALIESLFSTWAVIFVQEVKGLSQITATSSLSAFYGGLTLGRLLVSLALHKIPPLFIWQCLPVLLLIALFSLPYISTPEHSVYLYGFAGLACSAFVPLMFSISSESFPHAVSWITSMLTAAIMCGVGIGSLVVGSLMVQFSLENLIHCAAVIPVLIWILIRFSQRFKPVTNAS